MNNSSRTRLARTSVAVAALVLALSSCTGPGSPGPGSQAGAAPADPKVEAAIADYQARTGKITEWPDVAPIASPPALDGKTVWYVPMVGTIPTMATIGAGLGEALGHMGAETKICDGQGMPTAIADCLRQARAQGAAAVVTAYIDYNVASNAFEELATAGVPVLIGGVAPAEARPAGSGLAYFEQDIYNGAIFELAANAVAAPHAADTDVLWIRAGDTPTTLRASDMGIEKFKELCGECDLISLDASTPQLDKLASEVSAALVGAPQVNTVFVPIDAYVPTVTQGIASAGRSGQLSIISTGADLAGLQRIAGGQQAIDLGVPPMFTGWSFAHALIQHLAGEDVAIQKDEVVRFFDEQNVTDLTLDNASYASPDWYGDREYETKFLAAWGVE